MRPSEKKDSAAVAVADVGQSLNGRAMCEL